MPFAPIEEAFADIAAGKMVVLVDDSNRENEGDLTVAAEKITPEIINFMATHGRGWICLTLEEADCERIGVAPMVANNTSNFGTGFTTTIEARNGVTTGISAQDRATTIRLAANLSSTAHDFARPGHIQPIKARPGGVLVRAGQTEGSVDLCRLAGLRPAGVICEIMNEDGTMARMPDLEAFCKKHSIKLLSVAQIIEYRRHRERLIECVQSAQLPTDAGDFMLHCYVSKMNPLEHHVALTCGDRFKPGAPLSDKPALLRIHSECLTGDVFQSRRCDCGSQLHKAMHMVQQAGEGAIIYMRQEGRGIGLPNKIKAYNLQDNGRDTVEANEELGFPADLRDYGMGAQIILDLGIKKMRLITNNPRKIAGLEGYGLDLVERVPLVMQPNEDNAKYLSAKRNKLGHMLDITD